MWRLSHVWPQVSNADMQLFVIRHAVAEDLAAGRDDASRDLTADGRRKLRRSVEGLRRLDVELARVLTSPWKRAAETARHLAPIARSPPVATSLLTQPPGAELLALIGERGESTAVVGHEPWLGELVAWLAFGATRHGEAIVIKKAGVVWLEGSATPGGMRVRASLPPKLLRAIG